ncbi:MAG: DNA polymerase IV [Desulfitobacteriaceae bacterium]|nr:DNA polymerase IV [Desulfitobacteriaceae bacterium]MDD4752582.1 DNA polymerase IV [Desulfitobacteriaceae bacterium]
MPPVIFLVDMNAFFISCETTRNPSLLDKPAAVAGDPKKRTGIILAPNYQARAFGVKTAMVLYEALRLCPDMLLVPPDHHFYREKSQEVMNLLSCYTPVLEQNSIDEAWLDMTGTEELFGKSEDAAQKIMDEIKCRLGLWCSIGIAENKFLAKMASEMKKPLGITTLWPAEIKNKLWPLPLSAMYGVGKKTAEKLNGLGISTIGELARLDKKYLASLFGKTGLELYEHAHGIDPSPIKPHDEGDMKSIGRSTTLPQDIDDLEKAKVILLELAESIGMTARKHAKKGSVVQITLKFSDFKVFTRQTTVPATNSTKEIYQAGCALLAENWPSHKTVRLIGISLGGLLGNDRSNQMSLFDFYEVQQENNKEEKIDKVMDSIREKYGKGKITRASLIKEKE